MSENVIRDRSWRVDLTKSSTEHQSPSNATSPDTGLDCRNGGWKPTSTVHESLARTILGLRLWERCIRKIARSREELHESQVEVTIHDFAEILSSTIDPSVVACELVNAAKRVTRARHVELEFDLSPDEDSQIAPYSTASIALPLVCAGNGGHCWGLLRLGGFPKRRWNGGDVGTPTRPLKTLCTLAAMAFDGISTRQLFDTLEAGGFIQEEVAAEENVQHRDSSILRDATYLQVILPYALSQSQRHHEPLSIIHVEIDRLTAIHEMLGAEMVSQAVNHVGEVIGQRLRASDVVSRMEDDRILAMLPNATASDTSRIANEIRSSVEEKCASLPDLPPLTVSIGVASFPTHSRDVPSLLNAADEAMTGARRNGRNRVVVAAPIRV